MPQSTPLASYNGRHERRPSSKGKERASDELPSHSTDALLASTDDKRSSGGTYGELEGADASAGEGDVAIPMWLTLEPFITPYLFETFGETDTPIDEWELSLALGDRLGEVLEDHYNTFITEKDFAEIAGAGLNWVRIPLPFWAIEVQGNEPFLEGVSWKYFLKSIEWARKYGLRISLDLHAVPGSQNAWNHSGKFGKLGFMNGIMGIVNAERTLNYIRVLTEFICLPGNTEVIPIFGVLNEPWEATIGADAVKSFYHEAYETVRSVSGIGEGNGPMIAIHDGFAGQTNWFGFMVGADRVALDAHYYLCFTDPNNDELWKQTLKPCAYFGRKFNATLANFGVGFAGEFSLAVNDCGRFLNNVGMGNRFEGTYPNASHAQNRWFGDCKEWDDYTTWTQERKEWLKKFALAYMDTTHNWFFWTWKTGITLTTNLTANPMWSYQLALQEGFMPTDVRASKGFCHDHAVSLDQHPPETYIWDGTFKPWQTGGPGAGKIRKKDKWKFPPKMLSGGLEVKDLPRWTQTGSPITLPTETGKSGERRNDWWAPVEGCEYPLDPWDAVDKPKPTATC
ncbi:glycoside hydrolase family 5 protein [Pseudohyphozyma bogoriensis]|nr:glycoside hydrolase family 5 protein [Pseudohyphozyma bogoriensis]